MFELLKQQCPLFLDRDQGNKIMPEILRRAGLKVHCHSEFYSEDTEDETWIRECAQKGWLNVSSDKGLETDPINKLAVIESKAKVFILEENNARAVLWASAIVVSSNKIYELAHDNSGPFFARIQRETGVLVGRFKLPTLEESGHSQTQTTTNEATGPSPLVGKQKRIRYPRNTEEK